MEQLTVLYNLREIPERMEEAATWFHEKWNVPVQAYRESMEQSLREPDQVPQWFIVLDADSRIVAGLGIIENDFHERADLAPNVCAVFVEPECRGQGMARRLLDTAQREVGRIGRPNLYLVTNHTEFYERCGWSFVTMVLCESGETLRMYGISTS